MTFRQKLDAIVASQNSLVCVGLDSDEKKIPSSITGSDRQFTFNKSIIDSTHDFVCGYKPNSAFYEGSGADGVRQLKLTCDYLREKYPDIVIILDAKRADIGNSNEGYAKFVFDHLGADAVTLHPYLGKEALKPFLDRKDKESFIFCRSSNPGGGEFQDLVVDGMPFYQVVAQHVVRDWNDNKNCGLIVGAPYPAELAIVRRIAGDMPFLIPGIGAQGGDLEKTVKASVNSTGKNAIINASRSIIFAQEPRTEAQKLRYEINKYRS